MNFLSDSKAPEQYCPLDIWLADYSPWDAEASHLGLEKYVRQLVSDAEDAAGDLPVLVRFRLHASPNQPPRKNTGKYPGVLSLITKDLEESPHKLDLLSAYHEARNYNSWKETFRSSDLNILIHIRQGDTAVLETPWNTYIPVWVARNMKQYSSLDEISTPQLEVNDFYHFVKELMRYFGNHNRQLVVSSDGYSLAFERVLRRRRAIGLEEEQVERIIASRPGYDQEKFAPFESIENLNCIVGETDENLFDLIHSALTADLIIFGPQQRFIPRMIATYYENRADAPVLVKLENSPVSNKYLPLAPRAEAIEVNLRCMAIDEVAAQIHLQLQARTARVCG